MNVHPIFVHFPIALLTVYAMFEIIRLPILTRQQWYFPVKAVLLFVGVLGSFAAYLTGNIAQEAYRGSSTMELVRMHSTIAYFTIIVYCVLSLSYLIRTFGMFGPTKNMWMGLQRMEKMIFSVPVLMLGALAGLILITMTGALGGAIVYGPNIDPVVSFVYHLFFTK